MILSLVDLPWYDVVYTHIFIRLDLRDLCRLRCLSTEHRVLVDNYFATWDTLDLSPYSSIIEPSSFQGLVRACEGLRRLDLSDSYWLGSSHLVELLAMRPELTHLDLTGCNGLNMRSDFIETTKCRNLTSVTLRGCAWVTADFLSTLLRYNRNLRRLVLSDCHQICDEAVVSMFEFRTTACIRRSNSYLPLVFTIVGVFVDKLPNRRSRWNLIRDRFNDRTICRSKLTHVSLERTTISDESLHHVSEHCRRLEDLDLRSCPRITDKGLMLLRSLSCLKNLRVSGCVSITERGLAYFRDRVQIDLHQSPISRPRLPCLQV